MRLMSLCTRARIEPTSSVSTATTHTTGFHWSRRLGKVARKMRSSAANPAALAAAAMNPVAGVGEPWYTSGVHVWNGTAATLKPSPTRRSAMPARSTPLLVTTFLARNVVTSNGVLLAGMALLLVGLGFKVAAVPFHAWTPDVYQGSPTPATGFMAAVAKAAGFAGLLRVFISTFPSLREQWQP